MKYILRVSLPNKLKVQIIQPNLMSMSLQMTHFGIVELYKRDLFPFILVWNFKFQSAETRRGLCYLGLEFNCIFNSIKTPSLHNKIIVCI